jgi:enamine deaminase RidA (YjgF/YER057c/UK114 family)
MEKAYINPPNQTPSPYYAQAISLQGGRTIYISGQTAYNEKYEFIESDFTTQVDLSLKNLLAILHSVNANPSDIVSIHLYIKNYREQEHLKPLMDKLKTFFHSDKLPTSTLIGVQSLARDVILFEIEAIAVLPD